MAGLRGRLARLEARPPPVASVAPVTVLRLIVEPSPSGPVVVVAAMLRQLRGGDSKQIEREPGETLDAFLARTRAAC